MIKANTIILVLIFALGCYAITDSTMVLTPSNENMTIAKIMDKEIKEFDVFGIPGFSKSRIKMTNSKRMGKIQDYILDTIFQTEGNIEEIVNSGDYRRTYKNISKKIAVDQLREDLIEKAFLKSVQIEDYYKKNEIKYSQGMKEADRIKNDLRKEKSKDIGRYISGILDSLKTVHEVKYDEKLLLRISKIETLDQFKYADSLFILGANLELVRCKEQRSTVKDLAKIVKEMKPYHLGNLKKVSVIKSLIDGKILNELLISFAESKGYFDDKRVVGQTVDKMKYFVSSEYKKRLFNPNNLKPSKDELIDYYIEHKDDSELKTRKKMWTYEIFKFYNDKDSLESNDKIKVAIELENIRQKILAGESFEKYAKFYARPNTRDGELGYIYKTDHAKIGETANQLKANEVSELIIQEKAISIIKVTEVKKPQLYKFDYVEEIVKNRVVDEKRDRLKNELRRKLFKKYKVELLNAQ